ncbi:hypothetical protein [Flammeovirga sp. SJP92]|uniref:hypothetical protein n=1 Tax=Flammeovirga sp. SJP92 TaxID=1775430 RepID=UPI0007886D40|nr:hypothetical protein [Flammeovirga sp. SJP92]KXX69109.1 hypothetical protein AVL50_16865 [Flammeovirga sp. SJP92]
MNYKIYLKDKIYFEELDIELKFKSKKNEIYEKIGRPDFLIKEFEVYDNLNFNLVYNKDDELIHIVFYDFSLQIIHIFDDNISGFDSKQLYGYIKKEDKDVDRFREDNLMISKKMGITFDLTDGAEYPTDFSVYEGEISSISFMIDEWFDFREFGVLF